MPAKGKPAKPHPAYLDRLDFPAIIASAEPVLSAWEDYETKAFDTPTRHAIWSKMQRDLNAFEKLLHEQLRGTQLSNQLYFVGDSLSNSAIAGRAVRNLARVKVDAGIDVWIRTLADTIDRARTAVGSDLPPADKTVILTKRQRAVYEFLNGQMRNLDQIASHLRIKVPSAQRHVTALEKRAFIIHIDRQGYYRPDAPPPGLLLSVRKTSAK